MPTPSRLSLALTVILLGALAATLRAQPTTTSPADDILYEDLAANSSATITQVLPNSTTSTMTLENVRRIRVKQDILIIEWGATATTLLPRQFISAISINKRNPTTTPAR